jgi:hypothetical protein
MMLASAGSRPVARLLFRARFVSCCVGLIGVLAEGCTEPAYGSEVDSGRPLEAGATPQARDSGKSPRNDGSSQPAERDAGVGAETVFTPMGQPDDAGAFEPDQADGAADIDKSEAGPVASNLSPSAQQLVGRYAMRRRFFGRSTASSVVGTYVEDTLAKIDITAEGADKLLLRYNQCSSITNVRSLVLAPLVMRPLRPELYPERVLEVKVDGDSFHTIGEPHTIGYVRASPAGCSVGAKLPSPEKQWVAGGSCTCSDPVTPPTRDDDCRVVDNDRDGNPGFTSQLVGGGLAPSEQYSRIKELSQYVRGAIDTSPAKKHSARYQVERDELGFKCQGGCPSWGVQGCTEEHNTVFFEPIPARNEAGEEFDCADIVKAAEARELLVNGEPVFPADC